MATLRYPPHSEINKGKSDHNLLTWSTAVNHGLKQGRKRRLSVDEDMGDASSANGDLSPRSIVQRHRRATRETDKSLEIKRHKTGVQKRSVLTAALGELGIRNLVSKPQC